MLPHRPLDLGREVLAGAVGPIGFVRITGVGLIMIGVLGILDMAFVVIAAIKANDGYHYQYPFGIRFIK